MKQRYFLIPDALAERLHLQHCRQATNSGKYLVNYSDIAVYGVDNAMHDGAVEITTIQAKLLINQ